MGGPKGVEASLRQFGVERTNEVHLKPAWLISANFFYQSLRSFSVKDQSPRFSVSLL